MFGILSLEIDRRQFNFDRRKFTFQRRTWFFIPRKLPFSASITSLWAMNLIRMTCTYKHMLPLTCKRKRNSHKKGRVSDLPRGWCVFDKDSCVKLGEAAWSRKERNSKLEGMKNLASNCVQDLKCSLVSICLVV